MIAMGAHVRTTTRPRTTGGFSMRQCFWGLVITAAALCQDSARGQSILRSLINQELPERPMFCGGATTPTFPSLSWSPWGILRRCEPGKKGEHSLVLHEESVGTIRLVPGMNLSRYEGRKVRVFGHLQPEGCYMTVLDIE